LQSGASPNVYNIHHLRLVHLTVIDGEFDLLKLLLDHGNKKKEIPCLLNLENIFLGAHVNVITATHRKNLLHLICDRTVEESTENLLQILRTLIHLGCDINYRDDCFETPLMCTLHHGGNITLGIFYFYFI
jgi:hypothetical protein